MNLNGKCVFPGQFDTYSSITIDTDLATIDPRNDSYPGSSSLFKQSSFHSACTSACVRACVCVCVCVWRRVTCLFHGIKEQLKTEKMWQTIPILFDYRTNFSFSCLVLNLQWHNQTIAVYQISSIKQVHQFSKQFFTVHFFNKALSTTVTFSTHLCEQNCFGKTDDPVIDTKSSRLAGESSNNQ